MYLCVKYGLGMTNHDLPDMYEAEAAWERDRDLPSWTTRYDDDVRPNRPLGHAYDSAERYVVTEHRVPFTSKSVYATWRVPTQQDQDDEAAMVIVGIVLVVLMLAISLPFCLF